MAAKYDFESPEYDTAEVLREDARIDFYEQDYDRQRRAAKQQAFEASVLQYAVKSCLNSCLSCLDLLYIPREDASVSYVAIRHNSWQQETEPEPCSRDSWLRGAIPEVIVVPPARLPSTVELEKSTLRRPRSGIPKSRGPGSVASTSDLGNAIMQHRASMANPAGRPASPKRPTSAMSQSVKSSKSAKGTTGPSSSSFSSSTQRPNASGKHLTAEQQEQEDRLRQELHLRRQQEVLANSLKQKDEQAKAAVAAVQKNLKGKEYTYDSKGQVVLLNKINPDQLPVAPGPQFTVHHAAAASAAIDAATAAAAGSAKQGSLAAKRSNATSSSSHRRAPTASLSSSKFSKKLGAISSNTSSDFIQTESHTQPSVLATLKPAAGVTVRAGAAAKQGPKRDAAGQQTRSQFQQTIKVQNQQAARAAAAGAAAAPPPAGRLSSIGGAAGPAAGGSNVRLGNSAGNNAAIAAAANAAGPNASPAGGSERQSSPATAAAPALSAQCHGVAAAGTSSSSAHRTASQATMAVPGTAAPAAITPDVNLALVSAADWGIAGGAGYCPPDLVEVVHPSEAQIKEEFGRTTHLPKARAPVATLTPPRHQPSSPAAAGRVSPARR